MAHKRTNHNIKSNVTLPRQFLHIYRDWSLGQISYEETITVNLSGLGTQIFIFDGKPGLN
jgi:hypothetical protein